MNKRIIQALFSPLLMFLLIGVSACEKTYSGKVIDADTKEPIEGAVVVATWLEEIATVAGPSTRVKDVKETLADKNGNWVIKGPRGQKGGNITAIYTFITGNHYTRPPSFIIFKPGYCSWPEGKYIDACEKMKGRIEKTIELPKLTNREDRRKAQRIHPGYDAEDEKIPNFIRLKKEERKNLGLDAT